MKVIVIPIVIGALGTVTKGLLQRVDDLEIRGRVQIIQNTAKILRRVLGICGDLLILRPSGKPSANAGEKISQTSQIIIINLLDQ